VEKLFTFFIFGSKVEDIQMDFLNIDFFRSFFKNYALLKISRSFLNIIRETPNLKLRRSLPEKIEILPYYILSDNSLSCPQNILRKGGTQTVEET